MRRQLPITILVAAQLCIAALALCFHTLVRPELQALYRRRGATPFGPELVLSRWFMPALALGGLIAVAAALWQRRGRARLRRMGAAVAASGLAVVVAALLAIMPVL